MWMDVTVNTRRAEGAGGCSRGERGHCVFLCGSARLGPECFLLHLMLRECFSGLKLSICSHEIQAGLHCSLLAQLHRDKLVFSKQDLKQD